MGKEMLDGSLVGENTLLIQKTVRSGQSIKHSGNVVILGDVNPGAEIIAGGHIIVMGVVRGIVHAGAFGEEKATVTAFALNPTQIRISGKITRPPDEDYSKTDEPETARIKDGVIVIEKYKTLR
ncbi:MAG: septum site-determining protein MinC [Bacillota bacterium]